MKNIFSSVQDITISSIRLSSFYEKLKTLTLPELLWSLFAGFLSRGVVFGITQPFGLALYAAYCRSVAVKFLMAVFIFTGCVTRGDMLTALKQIAVIFLFEWLKKIIPHTEQESNHIVNALFMGSAAAITGIFVFIISGQTLEFLLVIVIEVILVSTAASIFSLTLSGQEIPEYPEQKNLKFLGVLTLGGAFLLGISGFQFLGVRMDHIAAGTYLLMLSRYFGPGVGTCAGAIAGLTLSSGAFGSFPALTCVYAVTGMTAGMLQKYKAAAGAGFLLTRILFMFTISDIFTDLPEIIIPVVLFMLLPELKPGKLLAVRNRIEGITIEPQVINRYKGKVSARLSDLSRALYKMGHIVEKQIKDEPEEEKNRCDSIIEQLTERVCSHCTKAINCWETRLFHTYKVISELTGSLQDADSNSGIKPEQELNRFCVKSSIVIDTLLRIIEIKQIEKIWQGTVYESRSVIPGQIYSLSEIISVISGEVMDNMEYFGEEEKTILKMLRKQNYPVLKTEIQRSANGGIAVEIGMESCKGYKKCTREIEGIVSGVLGTQMKIEEGGCKNNDRDRCLLFLKEKENLSVTTGVAQLRKDKSTVTGDCFTFFKTREGKYVSAVCDGMGSGRQANRLSQAAIGLFEQLLECRLSIRHSLGLVNMMLQVKNSENYTTMDISAIDLYTGETEFYKMGAVPTIIANRKCLNIIQINNLPAGLQRENLIQPERKKVRDGEFIIMMTDGVYDRLKSDDGCALEKIIHQKHTLNPQELAEHILKNAAGKDVSDDMTVLVAKLWRKTWESAQSFTNH